jgi:hypothetical protein
MPEPPRKLPERVRQRKKKKPKQKRPQVKRYLWGILHGGNALVLCATMGFMIGTLLTMILWFMFDAEMMFVLGFYLFAGMLGGTAVGGGIGYVLSGILPNASSESVSDQLNNGFYGVLGGFVVTGIGFFCFGQIHEAEKAGQDPGQMFKIGRALYDLVGKWGVLVVLVGGGLTMIGFGVRAMIPKK